MLPNVSFTISTSNLGRLEPNTDNVAGIILCGITGLAGFPDKTTTILFSLQQAEDLGLTSANDLSNGVLGWFHVSEFFRMNPSGELHVYSIETIHTVNDLFDDTTGLALPFIRDAKGRIKQLTFELSGVGVAYDTFIADLPTALLEIQTFCNLMADEKKWIDVVFVPAYNFTESLGSLIDIRTVDNPNCCVIVGNDPKVLAAHANYARTLPQGTVLGSSTNKLVHDSFGWAQDANTITTSLPPDRFLDITYKITGPDDYKNNPTNQGVLLDKGFVFPRNFANRSGFYWVQSQNTSLATNDLDSVELVQVINKVQRTMYNTLIPYVNQTFNITDAGRLATLDSELIKDDITNDLEANVGNNYSELTEVIVDPAKDANNDPYPSILLDKTLRVFVGIRAKGKAVFIEVEVGFVN